MVMMALVGYAGAGAASQGSAVVRCYGDSTCGYQFNHPYLKYHSRAVGLGHKYSRDGF
ncbi:Protein of unknown function [Pyronema omphalodes CBS 100304]|uniref:Uncharacterized protein n=1 Tax=Pyronema omphalodes (strain CBS 100304) TaxID=1076935 RepID=U4KW78_PYROM|nr:Protein of unknown function [Pyronema omphalodes CBS 100304]